MEILEYTSYRASVIHFHTVCQQSSSSMNAVCPRLPGKNYCNSITPLDTPGNEPIGQALRAIPILRLRRAQRQDFAAREGHEGLLRGRCEP